MFALTNAYIGNLVVVIHFERDESVRLQQAHIEGLFKPLVGSVSENLNVPDDAPAEIPRIIFRSAASSFQVVVSQSSIQLDWRMSAKPGEMRGQLVEIRSFIEKFQKTIGEFKLAEQIRECVLVLLVRCPDPRPYTELSAQFAEHYLNVDTRIRPNSASFKAVFHKNDTYFVNVDADTYLLTTKPLDAGIAIGKKDDSVVVESGVLVKLDVNTKLQSAKQGKFTYLGLEPLVSIANEFIDNEFQEIFSAR